MDVAIKKVRNGIDRIFDKTLQDLIRGVRNSKGREKEFITEALHEIREELNHPQTAAKAVAVSKLCFLQMLGYEMNWAAFNIVEIMSSTKLSEKRLGYWAASQCFDENTDVLMLTTNLIKKDIMKGTEWESGLALGGLACFMTPDLARDLTDDIISLMSSTRPYVRKRAVLVSYKLFLHYPEALRVALPRLREKLEDKDPGVQAAAVNVICELARKNPQNYLPLSQLLLKLMNKSTNNWVLIKIIKLFGSLIQFEPRLGKKLEEPLKNLINSTSAMSLLYECINTLIRSKSYQPKGENSALIQLCVDKLRILIEDNDQNLKYLGLLSMITIIDSHPIAVFQHKDIILKCLDDKDESIRLRSLDLITKMVNKSSLMEIVQRLLEYAKSTENVIYRNELVIKMVHMCSQNNYGHITNFEWYLNVLLDLAKLQGKSKFGDVIAFQILDVTVRVKSIRKYSVEQMQIILFNLEKLKHVFGENGSLYVLRSAAWICGEFLTHVSDRVTLFNAMVSSKNKSLPEDILVVFLQNSLKIFSAIAATKRDYFDTAIELYNNYMSHCCVEVQERANIAIMCITQMKAIVEVKVDASLDFLFKGELNPVGAKAQKKVPIPPELNLEESIHELSDDEILLNESTDDEIDDVVHEYKHRANSGSDTDPENKPKLFSRSSTRNDINYLKDPTSALKFESAGDYQTILSPQENEKENVFETIGGSLKNYEKAQKSRKSRKKKKVKKDMEVDVPVHVDIEVLDEEMPEGAQLTESDDNMGDVEAAILNIDLTDVWDIKKTKKKSKKKAKQSAKSIHTSSDETHETPTRTTETSIVSQPIASFIELAENIDLNINMKRVNFDGKIHLILRVENKHKSRIINNIELQMTEHVINNKVLKQLGCGKTLTIPICMTVDHVKNYKKPILSAVLSYKVESKSKGIKTKKIKMHRDLPLFSLLSNWSINDDELVDLLHTKHFPISSEHDFDLQKAISINELVDKFNGCFCVQVSDVGISLCGQYKLDGGKFVMLLKLKSSTMSVHVSLKAENEDLSTAILHELSCLF